MAGYKGAGLALMLGLLAGTLNGALFGRDCVDFNAEPDRVTNTGQFVVALDPSRFQKSSSSRPRSTATCAIAARSKALPGESVRLPGDQRAKRRAERIANGLALPAGIDEAVGCAGERNGRETARRKVRCDAAPTLRSFPRRQGRAGRKEQSLLLRADVLHDL